ncbi:MAG: inositol 2-dehydrogenase [Anaerolineaceae bacterium]|jgi:myo-inositol 2-dehydrogenase/D-chiro-inositol 1-dehydrogenase
MEEREAVRVGVIGAGRIGKIHAEDLATRINGAKASCIADPLIDAAQETAKRLHIEKVTADYHEILDDPEIDAVAICSPTALHAEHIVETAQAHKHIFCEKPISYDLQKIDRALAAVEKAGVKLQIGFNRRFDVNFHQAHELVASGKIGVPHLLRITSRDPHPPSIEFIKQSGGIFFDMTIHDFDMAQYMFGDIEEVYAVGNVLVDARIGKEGDIDTTIIMLKFKSGAMGTIDNSRQAIYGYDQRLEAFGSEGMVQVQNIPLDSVIYSRAGDIATSKPMPFFLERYRDSFIREMAEFIECVRKDSQPPITGHDARKPVVIGLAAQESFRTGRPVKLSEIVGSEG